MYERHFGLNVRPFSIAPDPRYLFLSRQHREALAHLLYGIREHGGFVVLSGEVGTGKTLLTRALIERLPDTVDLALIVNPTLEVREFLLAILAELQLSWSAEDGMHELLGRLNRHLLKRFAQGRRTVVLIDEAHGLSPAVIEQIRLLTNLETTREKLLQIVLVGQPELRELLQRRDLRQVCQRVTARYHLRPLSRADTAAYIAHRCRIAGADRPLFTKAAQRLVYRLSGGIPRLINLICDRALLGAWAHQHRRAGTSHVWRAAREIRGQHKRSTRRWPLAVAATALFAVALFALDTGLLHWPPTRPRATASNEAAHPALTEWLNESDTRLSTALAELLALWDRRIEPLDPATVCDRALDLGLRCYYAKGDLHSLRQRNLPAILELQDSDRAVHRVVALRLDAERLTLRAGKRQYTFPLSQVEAAWHGDYLLLWQPPAIDRNLVVPGSRGLAVDWLTHRLDRLDGVPWRGPGQHYDETVAERVRQFQREHGLTVDGIVGEETLFHLMTALPEAGTPTLQN